ncbi:hypothetical protein GQ53DRAFT_743570 [Thozetella sp. PMI_491]|nr:hypothetical protein GQ53DRAFT_743570 [Thozetella sp. PMI_491]
MGAQLAAKGVELPPLRSSSKEERAKALAKLDNIDGLIGVDEPLDESVNGAAPPAPTVAGVAALRGSSEQRRVSLSSRNSPPPYQRQAHPGEETYELRDIDISEDPVGSAPSYFPSNPRTSALPALAVGGVGLLPRRTPKKPISKPIADTPV